MAALPKTKQQTESDLVRELRWVCMLSRHTELMDDRRVAAAANNLLREIIANPPSAWFQGEYINQMGLLDFEGNFGLQINHDMNKVTLVRTSIFSNVHQFQRGGA